jgi:hypothetical protein
MNKNLIGTLLTLASVLLLAAGIIFLCICIAGGNKDLTSLILALVFIAVSNILFVLRQKFGKSK